MDAVLRDYLGKICYCYIDDIVIYSKTREEHVKHVEMVLRMLQQHERLPVPKYPYQYMSIDLVGPFTRSEHGHSYLFTLIDHLTGFIDAYPIAHKTGETIAEILHQDVFQ